MFRVSQHPSSGVLKTVTVASGTGHNTGTATSLQRGLIRPRWLTSQAAAFYEEGTQKLVPRYDKCLNNGGEYVEK